jgi:hypothetical protein
MTAPVHHLVAQLKGDELFTFEYGAQSASGAQSPKHISAEDLRSYCGGDIAQPCLRPERGAHSTKISEFPNAGSDLQPGDIITGLRGGVNVNFSYDQIVAGVVAALKK